MVTKVIALKVQRWGNSLAVRIPASIARNAHFEAGTPVEVALQEVGIAVKPIGERNLSLNERLEMFDPKKHGGEAMATGLVGAEKFK
jgi:antitoxin MazE